MSFFEKHYKQIGIKAPVCHFVLGSGFSPSLDKIKDFTESKNWEEKEGLSFSDIPQIAVPTVSSHKGLFRFFVHKEKNHSISFQCGRLHLYEGHSTSVVVQPVLDILQAGTKHFILSNISGGLKKEHSPGTVISLKDHVNMTGQSPLVGPEKKNKKGLALGPRFPDMSEVYDSQIREQLSKELIHFGIKVFQGVYVGVLGPELETPSQIQWLNNSSKGLFDAVGMSTVLEAIALKQAGACLGAVSLISNPATGIQLNFKEMSFQEMLDMIEPYVLKILRAFFSYTEKNLLV